METVTKVFGLSRNDLRVLTGERKKELAYPDGKLPKFSSWGGYTLLYFAVDGEVLCAPCASIPSNKAAVYDVFYEGPAEHCVECYAEIESSYGDPDSPEKE